MTLVKFECVCVGVCGGTDYWTTNTFTTTEVPDSTGEKTHQRVTDGRKNLQEQEEKENPCSLKELHSSYISILDHL